MVSWTHVSGLVLERTPWQRAHAEEQIGYSQEPEERITGRDRGSHSPPNTHPITYFIQLDPTYYF